MSGYDILCPCLLGNDPLLKILTSAAFYDAIYENLHHFWSNFSSDINSPGDITP